MNRATGQSSDQSPTCCRMEIKPPTRITRRKMNDVISNRLVHFGVAMLTAARTRGTEISQCNLSGIDRALRTILALGKQHVLDLPKRLDCRSNFEFRRCVGHAVLIQRKPMGEPRSHAWSTAFRPSRQMLQYGHQPHSAASGRASKSPRPAS